MKTKELFPVIVGDWIHFPDGKNTRFRKKHLLKRVDFIDGKAIFEVDELTLEYKIKDASKIKEFLFSMNETPIKKSIFDYTDSFPKTKAESWKLESI